MSLLSCTLGSVGVKRLDVDLKETELALAFELDTEQIHQQQVFAFLPLRSYGLRFIVQVRPLYACSSCRSTTWQHVAAGTPSSLQPNFVRDWVPSGSVR